jgi:hypothetical protein
MLSFGFFQYAHATIDTMKNISEFKGRKKVYRVIREFNPTIDEYQDDLAHKFGYANKGNGFYKMWEIMCAFDLFPKDVCTIAHIFATDMSIAAACQHFRKGLNDTMHIMPRDADVKLDAKLNKTTIHPPNINAFGKTVGKAHLVTAFGKLNWEYTLTCEADSMQMIIDEIICALSILAPNGALVLRMTESYTVTSCKLIYILSQLFDNVHVMKPLMSHMSSSEKFVVCQTFKPNAKIIEQFQKLHEFNTNVFPSLTLSSEFRATMLCVNDTITQAQFTAVNKIVQFVLDKNYYGEVYTECRNAQIEATKYWLSLYYPHTPTKMATTRKTALAISEACVKRYLAIIK